MALLLAAVGGLGVYFVYTSLALGWGKIPAPWTGLSAKKTGATWARRLGLEGTVSRELLVAVIGLSILGFLVTYVVFGGVVNALLIGGFAAFVPVLTIRNGVHRRRDLAREAWPRLIEEIRLLTSSVGRSIPQAIFEVGHRAPIEMQPAFAAAEREWLISTDFDRTMNVLKHRLADPTADATCETLLVAHRVGGSDLNRRLLALAEDRTQDVQGRKDARAKQAGVRFARRFVLIVPLGMALAGLSIGTGRSAYQTALGQLAVAIGIVIMLVCWLWAGRLMRLPEEERMFSE